MPCSCSSCCCAATTGQLSQAQFERAMQLLCAWWQQALPQHPPWQLLQSAPAPVTGQVLPYLQLQKVIVPPQAATAAAVSTVAGHRTAADSHYTPCLEEGAVEGWDEATQLPEGSKSSALPPQQQQQQHEQLEQQRHLHTYTVVWHEIYRVPVLYLAGCKQDGCPLTLAELQQDLPQLQDYRDTESEHSWTYLTAVAHPISGGPAFMLHPCQTAVRMQLLLQQQGVEHNACQVCHDAAAAVDTARGVPEGLEADTTAAAAAAPTADLRVQTSQPGAAAEADEAEQLLQYAKGWLSMVVPLLGMSMLTSK